MTEHADVGRFIPEDESGDAVDTRPEQSRVKVIFALLLGNTVDYYDAIFAYMVIYMALLFFVSDDSTASLLGTFAVFAVLPKPDIQGGHRGGKAVRGAAPMR